ncbi:leucine-rich repeat-containing protein 23-like [Limanda limanda]|uniref:leucine-rich repeat-containing protein 23-like n=1 Tax=Limanda limanda TaxID=27771 RepID=UPI0029C80592|nr:leucine-rich repeat-containing protein 23-like [Limanda limanda]
MEDSGLLELIQLIYPGSTTANHILDGGCFDKAIRAHLLIDAAIYQHIMKHAFTEEELGEMRTLMEKYLQSLSVAANQLTDLGGLVGPSLETLNLTGNALKTMNSLQMGCFGNLCVLQPKNMTRNLSCHSFTFKLKSDATCYADQHISLFGYQAGVDNRCCDEKLSPNCGGNVGTEGGRFAETLPCWRKLTKNLSHLRTGLRPKSQSSTTYCQKEEDTVMLEGIDEEDGVGEEEDETVTVCNLTRETIGEGLSLLCRTANGLGHAFVKLDLKDKRLNDIAAISSYVHVRLLDLSNNHLTALTPLASLMDLISLKVDNNALACLEGSPFIQLKYLQLLSVAANQLTDLGGLVGPSLETLNLTGNALKTMNSLQMGCFGNLVTLELRGNLLETTDGINLPNLKRLYLAQNEINRLEGLEKLENLTTLHLRENQLESLDGLSPKMKCLQYLNVRGNSISDENTLHGLGLMSKTLRTLVLSDNPLVETTDYRTSVLILVPQLEQIDKEPVSPEERADALQTIKDLREEQSK